VQTEQRLRQEADENLYYHRIALAHRDLTAAIPQPGRAAELLAACPAEWRQWEWHYLQRLAQSEPVVLRPVGSGEFRGLAFSPDGTRLAAACGDGKIRVWDRRTGQLVELPGHDGYVYSVAFHPTEANRLASSGSDGQVRVWDVAAARETAPPLPGIKSYAVGLAYCVAYSPNGEWLAAAADPGVVHVRCTATGELVHALAGHEVRASCLAFSPNRRWLATGSWSGSVRLWDASSGRLQQTLQLAEHRFPCSCVAFSPDPEESLLAAGYFDNRVDVWNVADGTVHRRLRGHAGFVTSVLFHPADPRRLASAGEDRTIHVWDLPSGRPVLQLHGHLDNCAGLAFSPSGQQLASASYDQTIRLWDAAVAPPQPREELHVLELDETEVWTVAFSAAGDRVAAAGEGPKPLLQVWDAATGRRLQAFPAAFTGVVFSIAFSPDGRRLAAVGFDAGAPPCVLKVMDLEQGQCLLEHREGQEIFAVAYSADGRTLAIGLGDGSIKLADAATGQVLALIGKHDRPIAYGALSFRRDGQRLVSASLDGSVCIWNLPAGTPADDANGRARSDSPTGALHRKLTSNRPGVAFWSVAYTPDGRHVVAGDKDGRCTQWDADAGDLVHEIADAARGAYVSVACPPNGRWIAAGGEDCYLRIYDARTLQAVLKLRGHMGPIHCLAASNRFVATGSRDKTVRIWDLESAVATNDGADPHSARDGVADRQ
jgi:WD40 repeat protein